MSRESFRQALVAAVEARKASWTDYALQVEYDNRIVVDTQTQTLPFLVVKIVYLSGEQADLGISPIHRVYGQVHIAAAVKEGGGTAQANALLDFFVPSLHMRSIGGARMYGSKPQKDVDHRGWVYTPVLIPFDSDTTS